MFNSIIYYVFQQRIFTARISFNVILNLMPTRHKSVPVKKGGKKPPANKEKS